MATLRTINRQIELVGRGKLTVHESDHVATGGEASVFRKSDIAIKIYTDPGKMRRDNMTGKIQALTVLQHPYIVAPSGLVLDERGTPIGLYMPYAQGEPFPSVFTNAFRTQNGFSDNDASVLVARTRDLLKFAHDRKATIVDGNELSYLLAANTADGPEPRIIDVDSWSIGRWPPTVIMPSIKDWHTSGYDHMTDWFAWAIVSFQVYIGIHPYKGTLDGYQKRDLEKRMKDNASVFTSGVRLNKAVRDFGCIPDRLLAWYIDTFQSGMREVPPSPFDVGVGAPRAALVKRTIVTKAGVLMYDKLYDDTRDRALRIFPCGVVHLESGRLYDLESKRAIGIAKSRDCEVVKKEGYWLIADWENGELHFTAVNCRNLNKESLPLALKGNRLVRYENRLFVVTDQGLTEVQLMILGKPILASGETWGVMKNSTRWFDGVGIMDAMGATFVIAPFGDNAVGQVRVPELDGLKPVMAKAGNRFVAIIAMNRDGDYRKFELTLDREYRTYNVWEGDADSADLNMAFLPKGVCATIVEDGEINIFVPTSGQLNKVQDRSIDTAMTLGNWDNTVVYIRKGEVWSLRMKP